MFCLTNCLTMTNLDFVFFFVFIVFPLLRNQKKVKTIKKISHSLIQAL